MTNGESRQCSNCKEWERKSVHSDVGVCYSISKRADAEYGNLTLESDGCKHWKPEPEAA